VQILLPSNLTVYGKVTLDATPWADDIDVASANDNLYTVIGPHVFVQLGGAPAATDTYVGKLGDLYYGTVEGGNIYHASQVHSFDWNNSGTVDRLKALYHATRLIDQFNFCLAPLTTTQVLAFPRTLQTAVPLGIEHATYCIADALLSGRDEQMDFEASLNKVETFGTVRTEFETARGPQEHISNMIPSPRGWALIKPHLRISTVFTVIKG